MKKFWKKHRALIIVAIVAVILIACGIIRKVSDPHFGHDHVNNPHPAAISLNLN